MALLRPVPGLVIMQPRNEALMAMMMETARTCGKPVVLRYPRGTSPGMEIPDDPKSLEIGSAEVLEEGAEIQIWALGDMLEIAVEAAEKLRSDGFSVGVTDPRFIKPIDRTLLVRQAAEARVFCTIENGVVTGGFGEGVEMVLREIGFTGRVVKFGWPDEFVTHGKVPELLNKYDITADAVVRAAGKLD
jgi:1-deoxy-D-xylulose-5-phosphate synthase